MNRNRLVALVAVAAVVIVTSACDARQMDDGQSGGQTVFDQYGNVIGGDPALGAALGPELRFEITSDESDIETGGTRVAVIEATLTDDNRVPVTGQQVAWSATGGVLQDVVGTTDENGAVSASLKMPREFKNEEITVSVSATPEATNTLVPPTFSATVAVRAFGTEISVDGPESVVFGDGVQLVASLTAGNGDPIGNSPILVSSSAGNSITPSTPVTDSDGKVEISVGTDSGSDTISLSALEGSVTGRHEFRLTEDILEFTAAPSTEYPVGSVNEVQVTWTSQGLPVVGQALRFSTTAGRILSDEIAVTDAAGRAVVSLTSPSAGPATITAEDAADGDPRRDTGIEYVATTPARVTVDASSTRVNTTEQIRVVALVTDLNGNPVKNRKVLFSGSDLQGGQLNPASAITASDGRVTVYFTAGKNATEYHEVELVAAVEGTNIVSREYLTVVEPRLNVTIGTSNKVFTASPFTQYSMPFVVQVADGGGAPLENASVAVSIRPLSYAKGHMSLVNEQGVGPDGSEGWSAHHWAMFGADCPTEDLNGNRVLDVDLAEDINGNGTLDPQDPASLAPVDTPDVATLEGGTLQTDRKGSGHFEMLYPASNAAWSYVEITARAQALGEEAEDSFRTWLPMLSAEIIKTEESPANRISPYGIDYTSANFCANED